MQQHMMLARRLPNGESFSNNNPSTILAYIAFQMYMPRTIQRLAVLRLPPSDQHLSDRDRDPLMRLHFSDVLHDDYIWYGMTRLIGSYNYDDALAYASNFYSMRPWLDPYTNETALHLTCKACALQQRQKKKKQNQQQEPQQHNNIIQFLIKSFPDAVLMQELYHGRTPLHLAAVSRDVPFEMYRILLLADPRASIIQDDYGCTPFDILWAAFVDGDGADDDDDTNTDAFLCRLRAACEQTSTCIVGNAVNALESSHDHDTELDDFLQKAALLLHAAQRTLEEAASASASLDANGGNNDQQQQHRVVELMFRYRNENSPSNSCTTSTTTCTRTDSLLILHAAITSSYKVSCPIALREIVTRMFLLAISRIHVEEEDTHDLLSSSCRSKRTLLSRCCECGVSWDGHGGLEDIVLAAPCALSRRDLSTNLFPFMQAACVGNYNSREQLDSIYCLLRFDPSAMRKALDCSWQNVSSEECHIHKDAIDDDDAKRKKVRVE
eukprot:CAMPEP_0116004884 /NCGR_PEP_ID=MMETSP0321-20121206/853_1 /TAXON_ID=163516 /ORGANISM="Leptocylindrus danicus var. danicus, Strain B650" /LENGTH=495 /DNA_ID=CAMNT_0003473241 /DNA_START=430 /DNA_END=1917 /DNA_ORIENTATION=-